NLSIDLLSDPGRTVEEKNRWLKAWMEERTLQKNVRCYEESTVLFDECSPCSARGTSPSSVSSSSSSPSSASTFRDWAMSVSRLSVSSSSSSVCCKRPTASSIPRSCAQSRRQPYVAIS